MADGLNFKVVGRIFDDVDFNVLPKVERYAIVTAAKEFVTNIKSALEAKYPKVNDQNPKYKDKMIDAIRFGRIYGAATTVHAYGTTETGSGTYRTRFLAGTKDRKHKKTKRFIGKIPVSNWFDQGLSKAENRAALMMDEIFSKYIENYY